MRKLYVVVPFFNPLQFKSRVRLYLQFKREMEAAGVQLLTVEAAFGDHDFQVTVPGDHWALRLRTQHVLWHKERLINLGFHRLVQIEPDAWNIGWFDSDVTFADPDWAAKTVHALMHHEVIQPFSQAIFLNKNEEELWHCPSSFYSFLSGRGYHQRPPIPLSYLFKGHPGLAWAATRRALDALGGVYDLCAAGSGDTVMSNALKGDVNLFLPVNPTGGMTRSIQAWAKRCDRAIDGRIGYVPGALLHHWHGPSEKRGYEKRWSILAFHDFDPAVDLELEANGLYRWAGNKPKLRDDLRLSLASRNEDE
jgi:hypothetical protein